MKITEIPQKTGGKHGILHQLLQLPRGAVQIQRLRCSVGHGARVKAHRTEAGSLLSSGVRTNFSKWLLHNLCGTGCIAD